MVWCFMATKKLTEEELRALKNIVEYMVDEKEDYHSRTEKRRRGHIYKSIRVVKALIAANKS